MKVIDLMDRECGINRKKLRCDSRLESDLGVVGDDTYELLEMLNEELGVDMTEFDCEDHITPEGTPPLQMVFVVVTMLATIVVMISVVPEAPVWIMVVVSLLATFTIASAVGRMFAKPTPELRIRDLVLSVEAGRWISPKAELQGVDHA